MLTTITTILGLLPMAFQINMNFIDRTIAYGGITSVWWVQLSTAVISGLAFSTILTLVVIPSMLAMPTNLSGIGRSVLRFAGFGKTSVAPETATIPPQIVVANDDVPAVKIISAISRHPEDSSIVPMPKKRKRARKPAPPKDRIMDAAE